MDNHDRKYVWQETRKRNMNWSPEGENPSINKTQKLPETIWIDQPQEALTKCSQSKLMK